MNSFRVKISVGSNRSILFLGRGLMIDELIAITRNQTIKLFELSLNNLTDLVVVETATTFNWQKRVERWNKVAELNGEMMCWYEDDTSVATDYPTGVNIDARRLNPSDKITWTCVGKYHSSLYLFRGSFVVPDLLVSCWIIHRKWSEEIRWERRITDFEAKCNFVSLVQSR